MLKNLFPLAEILEAHWCGCQEMLMFAMSNFAFKFWGMVLLSRSLFAALHPLAPRSLLGRWEGHGDPTSPGLVEAPSLLWTHAAKLHVLGISDLVRAGPPWSTARCWVPGLITCPAGPRGPLWESTLELCQGDKHRRLLAAERRAGRLVWSRVHSVCSHYLRCRPQWPEEASVSSVTAP